MVELNTFLRQCDSCGASHSRTRSVNADSRMKKCSDSRRSGSVPQKRQRASRSSSASRGRPQASHWSPRALGSPQWGHVPST